jgi:hypothetical protein
MIRRSRPQPQQMATPMRPTPYAPPPGAMREPPRVGPRRPVQQRPGRPPMGGAPQVPPIRQQAPQGLQKTSQPSSPREPVLPQPARAPVTALDPEVRSEGAWTANARIPGVGQKGSERGASNVRRRRFP